MVKQKENAGVQRFHRQTDSVRNKQLTMTICYVYSTSVPWEMTFTICFTEGLEPKIIVTNIFLQYVHDVVGEFFDNGFTVQKLTFHILN